LGHPRTRVHPEWSIEDAIAALDADENSAAVIAVVLPAGEPIARLVEVLMGATASLFPAWLPEAEEINDASDASVAAVRRLAARAAERSALFGPVVQALAARSIGGHADLSSVPVETLLRECFKLVCRSYGTGGVHLVLDTEGDPADLPHLVGWLAALDTFDLLLVHRAAAAFPPDIDAAPAPIPDAVPVTRGLVHLSAVAGRPSTTSETEKRIEARLRECPWAAGRVWNRRYMPGPLIAPIHPDLMFAGARLVVEFDGPDHLNRKKYAADRKRDRILQQRGFAVFRFTNDEVALDIERVIGEIAAEVARRIS